MKQVMVMVVLVFCLISSTWGTTYTVVSQTTEINETLGLGKYQTVVQAGTNALDRFTLHRVVKLDKHQKPLKARLLKGAFMLLPGGGSNFDIYMLGPDGESLATFLALKGMDVYGYSPRSRGVAAGYCDNHDCSAMANWGIATYLEDIEYVRKQVARVHVRRPVVGGLSLGAILTIAVVMINPMPMRVRCYGMVHSIIRHHSRKCLPIPAPPINPCWIAGNIMTVNPIPF